MHLLPSRDHLSLYQDQVTLPLLQHCRARLGEVRQSLEHRHYDPNPLLLQVLHCKGAGFKQHTALLIVDPGRAVKGVCQPLLTKIRG